MHQRIIREAAALTAASCPLPQLAVLCAQLTALTFGSPRLTAAEQLRANHFVHECEDAARLTRWHISVQAEISRREQAAARHWGQQALSATLKQLRPNEAYRSHRPRKRNSRPTPLAWVPGAPLPDRADRRAGTFDRRATACFQPANTFTYAQLLPR